MHVITHLDLGGAESVSMQLIEGLAPTVDSAIFVVLQDSTPSAIGEDMAKRAKALNAPVIYGTRLGFKSGGVLVAAWRLARAIRDVRPDVVHVHTEIPELTLAVACLLSVGAARTPLLRTVHNSVLWIAWARMGAWVTRRLAHGFTVAVSQSAADADAAIEAGVARPRATVLYNAVSSLPAMAGKPRQGSPLRVLFAGRLVYQKGADLLPAIIAAAQALAMRKDVEVIVAGEGAFHGELVSTFAGITGPWQVTMVPPIAQLSRHLGDYDCALLPSRFEGFGLLHLEVMMAGLPLLTCRAPGIDEVLPADYTLATAPGETIALASALAAVVDDIDAHRVAAGAYRADLARRFAPARMLESYLEHYRARALPKEQAA